MTNQATDFVHVLGSSQTLSFHDLYFGSTTVNLFAPRTTSPVTFLSAFVPHGFVLVFCSRVPHAPGSAVQRQRCVRERVLRLHPGMGFLRLLAQPQPDR